jgi:hypothetical protein
MEALRLKMGPCSVCWPLVADRITSRSSRIRIRIKVKRGIRIRNEVMRIRNTKHSSKTFSPKEGTVVEGGGGDLPQEEDSLGGGGGGGLDRP